MANKPVWNPVTKQWEHPKPGTSATPIPSADEQKKKDDQERTDFERETGKKYGTNSLTDFLKWKKNRKPKGVTAADAADAIAAKKE